MYGISLWFRDIGYGSFSTLEILSHIVRHPEKKDIRGNIPSYWATKFKNPRRLHSRGPEVEVLVRCGLLCLGFRV